MAQALLSVRDITSGYGHLKVLHGISFDVAACSVTAVIGPNGHGKTTLLRTISGLNKTWSGSVDFENKKLPEGAPGRVRAGLVLVPQGDQLFSGMTVEENLAMGAFTRTDAGVSEALEQVYTLFPRLSERRKQTASSLSGGERRMVGIGRGMMAGSRMMMIDEPSLGLAPLVIEKIYEALGSLASSGKTILVVEENPSRVADVASMFHLIDGGHLTWSGTSRDLKNSGSVLKTYLGD